MCKRGLSLHHAETMWLMAWRHQNCGHGIAARDLQENLHSARVLASDDNIKAISHTVAAAYSQARIKATEEMGCRAPQRRCSRCRRPSVACSRPTKTAIMEKVRGQRLRLCRPRGEDEDEATYPGEVSLELLPPALNHLTHLIAHIEPKPLNLRPPEWQRFGAPRGRRMRA